MLLNIPNEWVVQLALMRQIFGLLLIVNVTNLIDTPIQKVSSPLQERHFLMSSLSLHCTHDEHCSVNHPYPSNTDPRWNTGSIHEKKHQPNDGICAFPDSDKWA